MPDLSTPKRPIFSRFRLLLSRPCAGITRTVDLVRQLQVSEGAL